MFLNTKNLLPYLTITLAYSLFFRGLYDFRSSNVQWTFVLRQEKKSLFFLSLPSDYLHSAKQEFLRNPEGRTVNSLPAVHTQII